jgi:hypothetical protein
MLTSTLLESSRNIQFGDLLYTRLRPQYTKSLVINKGDFDR